MTTGTTEPTGPGYDRPIPLGDVLSAVYGPWLISCAACGAALLIGSRNVKEDPTVIRHAEWHMEQGRS